MPQRSYMVSIGMVLVALGVAAFLFVDATPAVDAQVIADAQIEAAHTGAEAFNALAKAEAQLAVASIAQRTEDCTAWKESDDDSYSPVCETWLSTVEDRHIQAAISALSGVSVQLPDTPLPDTPLPDTLAPDTLLTAEVAISNSQLRNLDNARVKIVDVPDGGAYIIIHDIIIQKSGLGAIDEVSGVSVGLAYATESGGLLTSIANSVFMSVVSPTSGVLRSGDLTSRHLPNLSHTLLSATPLVLYGRAEAESSSASQLAWASAFAGATAQTLHLTVRYELWTPE